MRHMVEASDRATTVHHRTSARFGRLLPESSSSPIWLAAIVVVGLLSTAYPVAVLVALAAGLSVFGLLRWPTFRLMWFLIGAILVFQTGSGLTAGKLFYLAGIVISVSLALRQVVKIREELWVRRFKYALIGSAVLAGWIVGPAAIYSIAFVGTGVQSYLRDSLTYLLISASVPIGIDASRRISTRSATLVTISVGAVAAYGFASAWIARRGFSEVPIDQLDQSFFASMAAIIVPLSLAITFGLSPKIKITWLAYAAALFLAVFVTGARTGLALAFIVAGLLGSRGRARVSFRRAVPGIVLITAGIGLSLPLVSAQFTSETFGTTRIKQAFLAITRGISQDQSGALRERAYSITGAIFQQHLLMGQGLGKTFPSPGQGAGSQLFSLDTPLLVLAKFGLVGSIIIIGSIVLVTGACIRQSNTIALRESTVARGAAAAWLALLPFGFVPEDKGFALSIGMLLVLVGSAARVNGSTTGISQIALTADVVGGVVLTPTESTTRMPCPSASAPGYTT